MGSLPGCSGVGLVSQSSCSVANVRVPVKCKPIRDDNVLTIRAGEAIVELIRFNIKETSETFATYRNLSISGENRTQEACGDLGACSSDPSSSHRVYSSRFYSMWVLNVLTLSDK
ncbi:hypothetical protein P175DRAFT_0504541 [Aspergillus ochraceoroseus IBT 24754]|uniref:Uncharacterized protein n=1 Tax=Aspergillus ochraceoroseus IBT 24754 TaxID=1392256 RepID=A0A2T5LNC8_9EURO|nr:uncharacterized protein P175DRAFT_0504541 [Aspergillus ochraceoroseus IBT 24754]PTU17788.1 hypothetical protein P175DRAFT_0504541 [Aspergillus ochraceoroseus IBT 24754]